MTNYTDEQLCDALVEAGIGELAGTVKFPYYLPPQDPFIPISAKRFCRDWRVAGACLERMLDGCRDRREAWRLADPQGNWSNMVKPKSLPRAIIVAFVESLK